MKRRFIAGILVIALGLTGCGSTETKEITTVSAANTAATFEMITTTETYTDTIATTSEAAITSEITTAPTTTVTDWTTFDLSEYYKYYNYNDDKTKVYKTLLEALIEKKEYTRRLNIQETSYNYLIENVDISDYEVLSDIEIQDAEIPYYFIDRCEIKVNVTRSDAPNFPVGERIWIFDYNEYAIDDLRDSEYVHTYISYFYQEKLDLRVKTAMYYSISFDCFETTNVNEYFNERVTLEEDIDCRGIVYDTGLYAWTMQSYVPEPLPPTPPEYDLYDIFPANYLNTVLRFSLVTDIDMTDYCEQSEGKLWTFWESGGEYGSYEITDEYIEIMYYADWSHIVPAKTVRYFFDDSEFPRLERLELIEDFGYEPCTSNPYI